MNEFQHKKGRLSPSGFAAMMTNGRAKDTIGKTALEYANRIALERLGVEIPEAWSKAIEWGNEWEEHALAAYEATRGMVTPTGNIVPPDLGYIAGTPDGLVGDDGLIEIKCPYNPMNHLANITENAQVEDYNYQMQGYMWITGRKWCDLVSYDPRFPEPLRMYVVRVERDQEIIDALATRAAHIEAIVQSILEKIN
jgi:hypothetical protein